MKFELNNEQKEIVNSNAKNIVVIAGAGSGKTRVLTERVKKLLLDGVNPSSIVIFTFTVMAAEELKQRLSDISGYDKMFVGTIHSYANFILRKFTTIKYEILTDESENNIMHDLCKRNRIPPITTEIYDDFREQHFDSGKAYDYIMQKYGYEVGKALRHILEFEPNDEFPITIKSIARINNYITFDKLIELATEYFEESGDYVDYLFVDEFQDIGRLEYNFIGSIKALNNFVVGDDYQSIYGFKGASYKYFQRLIDKPNWTSYQLVNNYRCGVNILDYANRYIKNCKDLKFKDSKSVTDYNGRYYTLDSRFPVQQCIDRIKSNSFGDYKDWFVLCRANKQVEQLMVQFINNDIPCATFKKGDLTLDELNEKMNENSVKILTIHASKGLENENVFVNYSTSDVLRIYDCGDGNYDIRPEEVRLYYVACTRAKKNLFVFH